MEAVVFGRRADAKSMLRERLGAAPVLKDLETGRIKPKGKADKG